jgi:hypothetical protein
MIRICKFNKINRIRALPAQTPGSDQMIFYIFPLSKISIHTAEPFFFVARFFVSPHQMLSNAT